MASPRDLDEFEIIRRYFESAPFAAAPGVMLGVGDDAAILELPAGCELVAAVDTLVAGRHFLDSTSARSVGHRALAVNLSDMAAMGATPMWATLALTLPRADAAWLEQFALGLHSLAREHGVALVGGDTTRGPLTISVQIIGSVPRGTALRRDGASAGDLLVVSGSLGDSGAGLALAQHAPADKDPRAVAWLVQRFDFPMPRVQFGLHARGIASAAMDISDGLAADLPKLARASSVCAHVAVERLPLSPALRAVASGDAAIDWALGAGDDYELLLAVPPGRFSALQALAARLNLTCCVIGELAAGTGVIWTLHGAPFAPRVAGYDHFGRASTQITV